MKTKAQEKPAVAPPSAEDLAFEAQLRERHPRRAIERIDFPSQVTDARAVYMTELTSRDTIRAAEMADSVMTDIERKSGDLAVQAERRESVRLSVVGVVGPHGDRRAIDQAKPLMELDDWSQRAWTCLFNGFQQLNGLPMEDVKKMLAGARRVGVAALATPADAAPTR